MEEDGLFTYTCNHHCLFLPAKALMRGICAVTVSGRVARTGGFLVLLLTCCVTSYESLPLSAYKPGRYLFHENITIFHIL